MRLRWAIVAVTAALAIAVQDAPAVMLVGTTGTGGTISTLVELDPATGGLLRTIGSVGYAVNGLTFDETTGKLYGSTSYNDPTHTGLIEIDLNTGAGTAIGTNMWGGHDTAVVTNITANSSGELFGWTEWWEDPGVDEYDDLVRIDKTTGIATRVGESGLSTWANGLAFDNSDTLYMVNGDPALYYIVDPATASVSYQGTLFSSSGGYAHHGDFDPTSNDYYGISNPWESSKYMVVADLSAGTVLSTLPTVDNLHTLAFVPTVIPEPSMFLVFGGLMIAAICFARRARKR